jgi:hypothetical protein
MTWPCFATVAASPPEPIADTVAHLLAAADMVQFGGWVQGVGAVDATGAMCQPEDEKATRRCGAGAIRACGHAVWRRGHYSVSPAELALASFLKARGWDNTPAWNDHKDRTAGEVADTLRQVAKELGEGGVT